MQQPPEMGRDKHNPTHSTQTTAMGTLQASRGQLWPSPMAEGTGALPGHCLCMSHVLGQAQELGSRDLQRKL